MVTIGYHAGDTDRDDSELNVAEIAAVHEFGTGDGRIPERSHIRSTVDEGQTKYSTLARETMADTLMDIDAVNKMLNLLGLVIRDDVKRKITTLKEPPNAQVTIDRKGSSNPLIDTGIMRSRVAYKVKL